MIPTPSELSDCILTRWHLGFNDPYLVSWIMVAIYLMVAMVALAVVRQAPFPPASRRRERVFWSVIAAALVFMALNKQADLQTLILATGRCLSQAQGWFDHRRLVQRIAVIGMAVVALGGSTVFLWGLRRALRRTTLPLLGLFLMVGFVLARAAELFHVGERLKAVLGGWSGRILELSGPLVIFIAAMVLLTRGNGPQDATEDVFKGSTAR